MSMTHWVRRSQRGTLRCVASALVSPMRQYTYPFKEDFVPAGARTSRFQVSSVPSERMQVIREYAFAPLFGSRRACFLLGTNVRSRKHIIPKKALLKKPISKALDVPEEDIEIGSTIALADRLLQKPGTFDNYRIDVETGRVLARSLIPVYLAADTYDDDDVQALGETLLEMMRCGDASDEVRELQELGFDYLELEPLDTSGFTFTTFGGETVSKDLAEMIERRWLNRLNIGLTDERNPTGEETGSKSAASHETLQKS